MWFYQSSLDSTVSADFMTWVKSGYKGMYKQHHFHAINDLMHTCTLTPKMPPRGIPIQLTCTHPACRTFAITPCKPTVRPRQPASC